METGRERARKTDEAEFGLGISKHLVRRTIRWASWGAGGLAWFLVFEVMRYLTWPMWFFVRFRGNSGYLVAAVVYLVGSAIWIKRARFTRRVLFRMAVCAISLFIGLGTLELVTRWVSPPPIFLPILPTYPHFREQRTDIELRGCSPSAKYTTNEWGLRGDPVPTNWDKCFTVLTIGGSTTHCIYLDDAKTWSYLLQKELEKNVRPVWVGNTGFDGHTTRGHWVVMDAIVNGVRPKLLVFLVGVNDLDLSFDERSLQWGSHYDDNWVYRKKSKRAIDKLRLYQIACQWKRVLIDKVPLAVTQHATTIPEKVDEQALSPLPEDLRLLLPSLPGYRANLLRIIESGQNLGCRMLFLTQPMLYANTPYWRSILGRSFTIRDQKLTISAATCWRMLDVFNRELMAVCKEQGVACFDLASAVPHAEEFFYDRVHFTEAGAKRVAKLTAEAVKEHFGLARH